MPICDGQGQWLAADSACREIIIGRGCVSVFVFTTSAGHVDPRFFHAGFCHISESVRSEAPNALAESRGEAFGRTGLCSTTPILPRRTRHEEPATKNPPRIRKKNISFATNRWNVLFVTFSGTIAENIVYGAKRKRRCQGSYPGRAVFGKRVRGERHFNPVGWYFPPSCSGRKVS